jgi:hypothetical protein
MRGEALEHRHIRWLRQAQPPAFEYLSHRTDTARMADNIIRDLIFFKSDSISVIPIFFFHFLIE